MAVGTVSLNNQRISNLDNATQDTDALNRITADNRFYQNTVSLDAITQPAASVSLNQQKLINVSNATLATDAMVFNQNTQLHSLFYGLSSDVSDANGLSLPYNIALNQSF